MENLTLGMWKQRTINGFNKHLRFLSQNVPTIMLLGDSLFERISFK